jgi:thiamine biosynthesis lipoprotein
MDYAFDAIPNMLSQKLSNIRRRFAMNTLFEIGVDGGDFENDCAAAEAALDEIARIEGVLSRFAPDSEVSRVNRLAGQRPVLISYELLEILEQCGSHWEKTAGCFDITVAHEKKANFQNVRIDSATRRISFCKPDVTLDFGAFGKGHALDCAARLLKENGVRNAWLHGGTSSVLAIGKPAQVGLRNPWTETEEIERVFLNNQGLSSSAVFRQGQNVSDIIDPHAETSLRDDAACVVIGPTAAEAEAFSTALLCMGQSKAATFCAENLGPEFQILWMEKRGENSEPILQSLPTGAVTTNSRCEICKVL